MATLRSIIAPLLVWLCCIWATHANANVLIVSSESGAAYAQSREAFIAELERGGKPRSEVRSVLAAQLASPNSLEPQRLIVTLGAEALRAVLARAPTAPVVASLIPRNVQERLLREASSRALPPITAVYLDQPLGRQLDLLRLALPEARRLGVLTSPDSASALAGLQSAAASRKMQLVNAQVEESAGLYPALRSVLDGADVLLALPDTRIYNSTSISNVLLSSYRSRIPVQAFSPAYVRAGALMAVYSSTEQIGTQTAEVARQYLISGVLSAPAYPAEFLVDVNEHVARSLGLTLDAESLLERLQRLERQERRP